MRNASCRETMLNTTTYLNPDFTTTITTTIPTAANIKNKRHREAHLLVLEVAAAGLEKVGQRLLDSKRLYQGTDHGVPVPVHQRVRQRARLERGVEKKRRNNGREGECVKLPALPTSPRPTERRQVFVLAVGGSEKRADMQPTGKLPGDKNIRSSKGFLPESREAMYFRLCHRVWSEGVHRGLAG